jgi:hypothetical protein
MEEAQDTSPETLDELMVYSEPELLDMEDIELCAAWLN